MGLYIRGENAESQEIIRASLRDILTQLRESLITKEIKEFSIAKSPYIENIPWIDVLELVKTIFENNSIKIIICEGTLQYVKENQRDENFKGLHASPIGSHRGVSKTFNRIRQNFYWENMKQDIQRRIQQCIHCQLKKLVRKIAKRFKIKRMKTTAFHPQFNGSMERCHHALGEFSKQYSEKDCE